MEKATYTPGPWRIGDAGSTIFGARDGNPAPVTVANLPDASPRAGGDVRRLNAALIAAAPDLLGALEKLVVAMEDELPAGGSDETRAARAALTKARGEVTR